jgi:predicted CXXCH cytochrome family protein
VHLRRTCTAVLAFMLFGMTGPGGLVCAEETAATANDLLPIIPGGRGERCVEETGFMRRNHMDLLDHQRDETVLQGVRGNPFSLRECLGCHVVYGPGEIPVTAASPAHFCRACHDYAAVSIDCFQCHASRPEPVAQNGAG